MIVSGLQDWMGFMVGHGDESDHGTALEGTLTGRGEGEGTASGVLVIYRVGKSHHSVLSDTVLCTSTKA